jgi:hypothetical protein
MENLTATEIQNRKYSGPIPGDSLITELVDRELAILNKLGLLKPKEN